MTYRSIPHPHLGASDSVLKDIKATQKTITVWPSETVPMIQDCFETTDWQVFRQAATVGGTVDLEEYKASVQGYITKCVEDITTTRTITIRPNQKLG